MNKSCRDMMRSFHNLQLNRAQSQIYIQGISKFESVNPTIVRMQERKNRTIKNSHEDNNHNEEFIRRKIKQKQVLIEWEILANDIFLKWLIGTIKENKSKCKL